MVLGQSYSAFKERLFNTAHGRIFVYMENSRGAMMNSGFASVCMASAHGATYDQGPPSRLFVGTNKARSELELRMKHAALNEGFFSDAILTKDVDEAERGGIELNVNLPYKIILSAIQQVREINYSVYFEGIYQKAFKEGFSSDESMAISSVFKKNLQGNSVILRECNYDHTSYDFKANLKSVFRGEYFNTKSFEKIRSLKPMGVDYDTDLGYKMQLAGTNRSPDENNFFKNTLGTNGPGRLLSISTKQLLEELKQYKEKCLCAD